MLTVPVLDDRRLVVPHAKHPQAVQDRADHGGLIGILVRRPTQAEVVDRLLQPAAPARHAGKTLQGLGIPHRGRHDPAGASR